MRLLCFFLVLTFSLSAFCSFTKEEYLNQRDALIKEEQEYYAGINVQLSDDEKSVDNILRKARDAAISDDIPFLPEHNFQDVKEDMEKTEVFKLLKGMPKGAILHIHSFGENERNVKVATYRDDCWINYDDSNSYNYLHYAYSKDKPTTSGKWHRTVDLRAKYKNPQDFDDFLVDSLTFRTPGLNVTEDNMWNDFNSRIGRSGSLTTYLPVWKKTTQMGMQALVDDGIQYLELRRLLSMYDDNGPLSDIDALNEWRSTVKEFNAAQDEDHQLFGKFICQSSRGGSVSKIYDEMLKCVDLLKDNSDVVIGYDLANEEDRFHTLLYFIDDFVKIRNYTEQNGLPALKYFFHAGETDWANRTAMNLYDAVLLNTTRIGHGYAIKDFPFLMDKIKEKGIGIEVSPISNQMLRLVADMRNHPAVVMLHNNLPVTISSDDPPQYGYEGTTYDFYEAFMSWGIGLKQLKQLCLNSIKLSQLTETENQQVTARWQHRWDKWISSVLSSYN